MSKQQQRRKEREHLINEEIQFSEIRIVGEIGKGEVIPIKEALKLAYDNDKDLILINDKSNPAICTLEEYSKYIYNLKKKEKEKKANQVVIETKELKFKPNIAENDFMIKLKQAHKFISEGNKVKVVVQFRGREMNYKSKGEELLNSFATSLNDVAKLETYPKLEGKRMFILLAKK